MDQVNYKGYARSVGFDPIKAPYAALDRIQERDSRVISGMEENRRAIKEVRDQYGSALERKFSLESRDRDQNYAWEQKLADLRQRSLERNAQTMIQGAKVNGENLSSAFQSLAKFSTTLSEGLMNYKKAKDEGDMLNGYMEVASGQVSAERKDAQTNGELLLQASGEATDKLAEGLQKRGADPEIITNLLTGNRARDYGRLKAYWEMTVGEFPGWAQTKLDEMGATTAPQRMAAMRDIFGQFLQENGVFGLKADFMAEGLMKMRGHYNAFIDDARRTDIVTKSQSMRDDGLENVFRSKSGEAFTLAFKDIARSYNDDGRTPVGYGKARDILFKELSDTTRYTDVDVERILSEAMTDNGQSFRDRFGRQYDDLINARRQDNQAEFNLSQAEERQQQAQAEKQLLQWVGENWNGSSQTLQEIIKEAETKGIPTDRLKAYMANSNEQRNADFWTQEFTKLYEQGLLTTEDTDAPGIPVTVREQWRQRAVDQQKQRADSGISQDTLKQVFKSAITQNLIGDSTSRTAHFSSVLATDYALRIFNQKFAQYSKTMEPAKAAQQAQNDVLTEIQSKRGNFTVVGSAQAATGQTQAFYAAFTPGKHPGAPRKMDIISASSALRQVRANPGILNEKPLTSPVVLKDIDNRIKAGKPISIPILYSELSRATGGNLSPVDILNRQLKAAGLGSQVQPGFREQLNQINDPRLQAILSQPLTQDRLNTAINGSGSAPATIRTGPSGFSDIISLGRAAGFKFPEAMAAMWALESGYGKYQSGRNNVFNIKDRSTGGWKSYGSPLESANDFIYLMSDAKYASALASARTPRQFIEGIAMTYSGQEPDYADKIIRVMKSNGINPDQPYNNNPNPARNNAFMRPTLAYLTSGIGPTSTGPHLDVKQQDNPNTPQNEFARNFGPNALDNYVVVDDPKFGRVPLSRIPITNSFADHVARGSHGIDYGTADGTKLYVQNGARVVSKQRTEHGDKVVIQLPDGRRFSFLHGRSV